MIVNIIMSNPKFESIDLEHANCRVTKYTAMHIMPHLSLHEIKSIHHMINVVNTEDLFDTWSDDATNLLIATILFHEPNVFHENHNLDRICISFGSQMCQMIQQYIDLSTYQPITAQIHPIALNVFLLRGHADVTCGHLSRAEIIRFMKYINRTSQFKACDAYEFCIKKIDDDPPTPPHAHRRDFLWDIA